MTDTDKNRQALSRTLIALMKGIVARDSDEERWQALLDLQPAIRDHVAVLGLALSVDEAEGYAWLSTRPVSEGEPELPRLVARRPLSFPVSLILALLRRKLAESDISGESRLVLSLDEVVELVRVFLPATANEARLVDQIDTHLNKIIDLGFARRLRGQEQLIEVHRILKSFVDAQWLRDFDRRLGEYREQVSAAPETKGDPP